MSLAQSNLGMIVLFVIALMVIFGGISVYNSLVTLRNRFKNAFAQIDVQLLRRHDLIPNLVETAKGYLKHERETLEAVMAARASAYTARQRAASDPSDAAAMRQLAGAENGLAGAMGRLMVVSESYPDLKANTNMIQLSEELSSTENRVAFARQAYNDAVMMYNTARERFPAVLFSGALGFKEAELLRVEVPEQRQAPKVAF